MESLIFYLSAFFISTFFLTASKEYYLIGGTNNKIVSYIFTFISMFIPIIISGLRYQVGTDFNAYISIYYSYIDISFVDFLKNNIEVGYFLINKISYNLFNNYQAVFFISSLITVIFTYLSILNVHKKFPVGISVFLYFCIFFPVSMNIIRQFLAVAIVMYSYKYIFNKKLIKFVALILLATSFHTSALIFLPFYFVAQNNIKKSTKILMFLLILFFVIFYECFINLLSSIDIFSRYSIYFMRSIEVKSNNREFYFKGLVLILILFFRKKLVKLDTKNDVYIFFLIIDLILSFTSFVSPFIKRSGYYFSIAQIFLIPSIMIVIKESKNKMIFSVLVILFSCAYFVLMYYIFGFSNIIPYNWILNL